MRPLALDACARQAAPSRTDSYGFCALALEDVRGPETKRGPAALGNVSEPLPTLQPLSFGVVVGSMWSRTTNVKGVAFARPAAEYPVERLSVRAGKNPNAVHVSGPVIGFGAE
jgi:hypothetical protein